MFEVGNIVKIIDDGEIYPSYENWFITNKIPIEYCLRWQFEIEDENIIEDEDGEIEYEIVAKHKHQGYANSLMCYLIQAVNTKKVYLINEKGIDKYYDM